MLTKELLQLPDAPSLLAQRCKLWRELPELHHLRFVTVYGLRVVCIPTISYLHCQNKPQNSLYHTFIARTNPKTLRGLARALSESSSKRTLGSLEISLGQNKKCPVHDTTKTQTTHFFSRTPAAREAVPSPTSYDCTRPQQV